MKNSVIAVSILIVVLMSGGWYLYEKNSNGYDPMFNSLLKKKVSIKSVTDFTGEIGVKSVDDVSFSQNEKSIKVRYGNFVFNFDKKELTKAALRDLERVGIKVYVKKDGGYFLEYKGAPIKETFN